VVAVEEVVVVPILLLPLWGVQVVVVAMRALHEPAVAAAVVAVHFSFVAHLPASSSNPWPTKQLLFSCVM
jgi:hypothetical protein